MSAHGEREDNGHGAGRLTDRVISSNDVLGNWLRGLDSKEKRDREGQEKGQDWLAEASRRNSSVQW